MFGHHSSWYRVSQDLILYKLIKIEVCFDVSVNLNLVNIRNSSNNPSLSHVIASLSINEVSNNKLLLFKAHPVHFAILYPFLLQNYHSSLRACNIFFGSVVKDCVLQLQDFSIYYGSIVASYICRTISEDLYKYWTLFRLCIIIKVSA